MDLRSPTDGRKRPNVSQMCIPNMAVWLHRVKMRAFRVPGADNVFGVHRAELFFSREELVLGPTCGATVSNVIFRLDTKDAKLAFSVLVSGCDVCPQS